MIRSIFISLGFLFLFYGNVFTYPFVEPLGPFEELNDELNDDVINGTTLIPTTLPSEETTEPYTPPPINRICKGHPSGTYIVDPSNHSIFYECGDHGRVYRFECPDNLVFDVVKHICVFDENATTERVPDHGKSKFDCRGKKDGYYPDEHDKHIFHQCQNGYPSDFECPPTTIFDLATSTCVYEKTQ